MKILNNNNLSGPHVRAAEASASSHPPRKNQRSVTQLTKAPRQLLLERRHWDDLEQDATELLKPMIGTAWHAWLAKFVKEGDLSEHFSMHPVKNGWELTGTCDLLEKDTMTLVDHKTSSIFGYLLGQKFEHVAQLNIYRWLLEKEGFEIKKLKNDFTFTDHKWREALRDPNYPQACSIGVDVPMWTMEKTEAYINERMELHAAQEKLADDDLLHCTRDEMWQHDESWAVKKNGGKRALNGSVSKTEAEAVNFWKSQKGEGKGHFVEYRPGERVKCDMYCVAGKSGLCNQWNDFKKAEALKKAEAEKDG